MYFPPPTLSLYSLSYFCYNLHLSLFTCFASLPLSTQKNWSDGLGRSETGVSKFESSFTSTTSTTSSFLNVKRIFNFHLREWCHTSSISEARVQIFCNQLLRVRPWISLIISYYKVFCVLPNIDNHGQSIYGWLCHRKISLYYPPHHTMQCGSIVLEKIVLFTRKISTTQTWI